MARNPPAKPTRARAPTSRVGGPKKAEPAPAKPALTPDLPAPEVITVRSGRVACDGVGGALGHPRVYLEMGEAAFVECPYCDRRFVLAADTEGPESEYLAPGVYEGSHGH
ncbi:MAG TPA: zinc-finger domain-containing protein [Phenylobacterium sp.]|jgi:uncharacterized Zn-finger protein